MDSDDEEFSLSESDTEDDSDVLSSDDEPSGEAEPVDIDSNFAVAEGFSSDRIRYPELTTEEEDHVPLPNRQVFPGLE